MKRGLVGVAVALVSMTVQPAPSEVIFAGGCLVSMSMSFSPPATYTSLGSGSVNISMGGTCVTEADTGTLPGSLIKSIGLSGSGSALVNNCTITAMNGFYTAAFSPQPAPPGSSGTFVITGDLAAVHVTLVGGSPLFVGEGVLAGLNIAPLTTCASSGASSMTFLGTLVFGDP